MPPDARIEVGATEDSVSSLDAEVGCREDAARSSFAALAWTPAELIGEEQRVAVTIFAGSLLDVPFEVSPPLAPSISDYEWVRVSGQAEHTWTVLTLRDGVWYAGPPAYFTGPTCVSDEQP